MDPLLLCQKSWRERLSKTPKMMRLTFGVKQPSGIGFVCLDQAF